jgi:hypothetical protein
MIGRGTLAATEVVNEHFGCHCAAGHLLIFSKSVFASYQKLLHLVFINDLSLRLPILLTPWEQVRTLDALVPHYYGGATGSPLEIVRNGSRGAFPSLHKFPSLMRPQTAHLNSSVIGASTTYPRFWRCTKPRTTS